MTPEAINARIIELNKAEQEAQQRLLAAQADMQAIHGAKLDCQHWLNEIMKPLTTAVPAKPKSLKKPQQPKQEKVNEQTK